MESMSVEGFLNVRQEAGFGYDLLQTNFTGAVYLHFQDWDSNQANDVVVSGRDAFYLGLHSGSGKWVVFSVPPGAAKNGILNISPYKPAGSGAWSFSPRITC
jgi:hypothetical protein